MSVNKVIDIAINEIGYVEKASNNFLDLKFGNAGNKNYTKYAKDLDSIANFYNSAKNGHPWCAVFVNWCFVQAFGVDKARRMCFLPIKSGSAGCTVAVSYYKNNGAFYNSPKVGDQVFFYNSKKEIAHTGIVEKVTATTLYTIEGNTSSDDGVVENGGCVCRKSYNLNYNRIVGYGRPNYNLEIKKNNIAKKPLNEVKEIQIWLNNEFNAGLVIDGVFGFKTESALIKFVQKSIGVTPDGDFGPNSKRAWKNVKRGSKGTQAQIVQAMLICLGYPCGEYGADGDFGSDSVVALKQYQKDNKLVADGIVGMATATKLFKR